MWTLIVLFLIYANLRHVLGFSALALGWLLGRMR